LVISSYGFFPTLFFFAVCALPETAYVVENPPWPSAILRVATPRRNDFFPPRQGTAVLEPRTVAFTFLFFHFPGLRPPTPTPHRVLLFFFFIFSLMKGSCFFPSEGEPPPRFFFSPSSVLALVSQKFLSLPQTRHFKLSLAFPF